MERRIEELLRNIQAMIKCPHCGSKYTKNDINIMGQTSQAVLVQLNCHICKMPVMATVVASRFTKDHQIISDKADILPLSDDREVEKSEELPVSSDEILEMHKFLRSFDGNFEQLFNK